MCIFILTMISIFSLFFVFSNTRKARCVIILNDIHIYEQTKELNWEQTSEYIDQISKNEQESIELKKKIAQLRKLKGIK